MSTRFERWQLWLILGIETVFLGGLAAWVLLRLGRLFEPLSLLVALVLVGAGDVVTALLMQRFAPTRITVAPGERSPAIGEVLSGFEGDPRGVVRIKGERWQARLTGNGTLRSGDRVRVVDRAGLILEVERLHDKS